MSFRVMYHKDPETDSARIVGFEVTPNRFNDFHKCCSPLYLYNSFNARWICWLYPANMLNKWRSISVTRSHCDYSNGFIFIKQWSKTWNTSNIQLGTSTVLLSWSYSVFSTHTKLSYFSKFFEFIIYSIWLRHCGSDSFMGFI